MDRRYKIVVTDWEFPDLDQEKKVIESFGDAELVPGQCKTEEEIIALAADADAVLNQYARLTPRVIGTLKKCKIIVRYGIGVDTVDLPAATKAGIRVCNIPLYGVHEVADHTIALLFSCIRKIPAMNETVKKGLWDCNLGRPVYRISGKTLGLVGFGNIPKMVAQKLTPWNLKILAHDPFVPEADFTSHGAVASSLEQLIKESDFISCHVPLTRETYHLFDYQRFKQMKPRACFINTSRGPVVDEQGLHEALQAGFLAGAALDVMENEPPAKNHPLFDLPNVIITPHFAWYSVESAIDLQRMAAEEVVRVLTGKPPLSCLNSTLDYR